MLLKQILKTEETFVYITHELFNKINFHEFYTIYEKDTMYTRIPYVCSESSHNIQITLRQVQFNSYTEMT